MREIKLLLSAKLCAVTVFAWLVSLSNHKNSASALPSQLSLLHICDPAGVEITAMLFAPRPKVVKNLKVVKLGQKT